MIQKEIRAVYDDNTIRVYQAYCREIAEEAVMLGTFGKRFKMERMTWIKPSFLWMMYRCGWGLNGIMYAQLIADVVSALITVFMAVKLHKKLDCEENISKAKNSQR